MRGRSWSWALRAAVLLALILLELLAHGRMRELRTHSVEARTHLAGALSPGEIVLATVLGGFRSIALNIVWVRLFNRLEEQRHQDLPGLYRALEALQGGSPFVYRILMEQMLRDIPRRLFHLPDERWAWIRRGLELLERGRLRLPGNTELDRHAAYLYFYYFHPTRSPLDRERFLRQTRDGSLVAYGRDPLLLAVEAGERALRSPRHPFHWDVLLWVIYREAYSALPEGRAYLDRAGRLLAHAREAHPGEPYLSAFEKQIEEEKRVEEERR